MMELVGDAHRDSAKRASNSRCQGTWSCKSLLLGLCDMQASCLDLQVSRFRGLFAQDLRAC